MVKLVKHDLQFILNQIEIAEAHSAGTPLTELVDTTSCSRTACARSTAATTTWHRARSSSAPPTS